jgi:GntR family transcriptional regulator/MocR family aminotransferase
LEQGDHRRYGRKKNLGTRCPKAFLDASDKGHLQVLIPLKIARDQPLQQQLYDQLHVLIASSRLMLGTRMPSTRMLAEQFSISRTTVLLTYERLLAEGWLKSLPSKGTFVAHPSTAAVPERAVSVQIPIASAPAQADSGMRIGRADPSLFPAGRWRALTRSALGRLGAQLAGELAAGHPRLRTAIAGWLSTSRGLAVAAEQIVLVNGRQEALHVAGHLLLRSGMRAVVEDPCDPRTAATFAATGAELVRVPVDLDGLCAGLLPEGPVALAHVTPEHQRPLGVTLTAARRTALLQWAERTGAMIVEEDCEGELRYHGMDVPPLVSLDGSERVILIGGFCSTLGPWLSLGYMVLPHRLVADALAARRLIDDSPRWLEETALAEFLLSGGYARHVHRLGKIYASRRDALVTALRRNFGETTSTWGAGAGLHLTWFPPQEAGAPAALAELARRCGLEAAIPAADKTRNEPAVRALLLGFGLLSEQQIGSRVGRFAGQIDAAMPRAALSAG